MVVVFVVVPVASYGPRWSFSYKRFKHKLMNFPFVAFTVAAKGNSQVSVLVRAQAQNFVLGSVRTFNAPHPPVVAYLVVALPAVDWSPLFFTGSIYCYPLLVVVK